MNFIKNKLRAEDVYDCFETLLLTGRLTGILPYYVLKEKTCSTAIHGPAFIFMMCGFGVYFASFIAVIILDETVIEHIYVSLLFKVSDKLRIVTGCIFMMFMFIDTFLGRKFYGEIVNSYVKTDDLFKTIGIDKSYNKLKARLIIYVIIHQCMNLLYMFLSLWLMSLWNHRPSIAMSVAMYYPGYIITAVLTLFRTNITFLIDNVKLINEEIKKIMDQREVKFLRGMNVKAAYDDELRNERFSVIMKLFDSICDAADMVNQHFTKSMLIMMAISFLSVVLNMFYVFSTVSWIFYTNASYKLITFLFFSLHQCLLHTINVVFAITICERCEHQVNLITSTVNKMLICYEDTNLINKLNRFAVYLLHRRPKFSACGFFEIDNTLFFTMVGAATTYLIILIQFTMAPNMDESLAESPENVNASINIFLVE